MPIDLSSGFKDAKVKINAYKTYLEVSGSIRKAKNKQVDFISDKVDDVTSTLDNVREFQQKIFRNTPTSFDELLSLLGITKGSGNETINFIKNKLIEASIKIEPQIKEILKEESLKILGYDKQQTYIGVNQTDTQNSFNSILVPIKSIDIFGSLKNKKDTLLGKLFYEKDEPSISPKYRAYGGTKPYPLNKEIRNRIDSTNKTYSAEYDDFYRGKSGQPLFDFSVVRRNNEDYVAITFINRNTGNNISEFLFDYFETIQLYNSSDFLNQIINALLGTFDIEAKLGYGDLKTKNKFFIILQRILGLCFDTREETDVSGTAKISEIDDFDDSIFELTEIDLRKIDENISNTQNGIIQFEDCNNVKLPIDSNNILNSILDFKDNFDDSSIDKQIDNLKNIIDSIPYNQNWEQLFPDTLTLKLNFDTDIIKKIPSVISSTVLSPKVLLPIFALLKSVESEAKQTQNTLLTDTNQIVENLNELNSEVNNYVNDSMDFLFKFKTFSIQLVSRIGALYLKTLYDILKKDIINLIKPIITDITKRNVTKKYSIILTLSNILISVASLILDYRKCRSLVDDLIKLLNLVNTSALLKNSPIGATDPIPAFLLPLTQYLPGFSPERSTINIIEEMQKLGIPTGPLPDGSPNLMLQFTLASQIGNDKEETENGKVVGIIDPSFPFIIRAKKI